MLVPSGGVFHASVVVFQRELGLGVKKLSLPKQLTLDRLQDRRNLVAHFDHLRREVDRSGTLDAMNRFDCQAYDLITGDQARKAIDLTQVDRHRSPWR